MASVLKLQNFIQGEFVPTENYLESINPYTEKIHALVPDSTEREVNQAVKAAQQAFPSWSQLSPQTRFEYLSKIAEALASLPLAEAECTDQGKPLPLAETLDIPRAIHNFRFFASAILHTKNECRTLHKPHGGKTFCYVERKPLGVAGLISPWNLPLYLLTWKIAPCIATGNTCVCKPSEFTSYTAWLLCHALVQANLPPGVVNVVFGTGSKVGAAIVQHPHVPLISFTGGSETGKSIATLAAPLLKKLSLELGGKNAGIVFEDCDLDAILPTCLRASFLNQGQICLCLSRWFVHASIYDSFLEKFLALLPSWKLGNPMLLTESCALGPLVSAAHRHKVLSYLECAKQEGGQIHFSTGASSSSSLPPHGYFVPPTVITGLDPVFSRCMQEEIFGPVVCVCPFTHVHQVVEWVNQTKYGLCASVFTQQAKLHADLPPQLHVGTLWINDWMVRDLNMPFGGVKESGLGREGWPSSLHFFTEEMTVCISS